MPFSHLRQKPFNLDDAAISWVRNTLNSLSIDERIAQTFTLLSRGGTEADLTELATLQPGGITRFFTGTAQTEAAFIAAYAKAAKAPPLISADLEGSRMSLPFGTQVLNPLGLAAVNDAAATREISRIMAEEAVAVGVNWSFTPVIDINHAWRSAIVGTRGFGSDIATIEAQAMTQIEVFQAHGVAATVKHWPGEGYDDRDQHLVTTVNPLSMPEWEDTYGRLYLRAIADGVLSIMSAHIALPSFIRSEAPGATLEAFRPASLSHDLNIKLLREKLGFNGLIVSDATPMGGFGAWCKREEAVVQCLTSGCDIILFSDTPAQDMAWVKAALGSGALTHARLDDAVTRILGLKAALGLHKTKPKAHTAFATPVNVAAAQKITRRAPTLVKDTQNLLPLSPARHKRVLVFTTGIVEPFMPQPAGLALIDMLRNEGFEVTLHTPETEISRQHFDVILYLFAEETLLTRSRIFIDWMTLTGTFFKAMKRYWHDIPCAMISFGYPYYLYDAPRIPTYINAYSTLDSVQAATLECLMGRAAWNTHSPVDPFCGQEDAKY